MFSTRIKIFFALFFIFISNQLYAASDRDFIYRQQGESYAYKVKETGINYNFRFQKSPGGLTEKKQAGLHVLHSVYEDDSIDANFSAAYKKERASCYALEARFYTYTLCFLPNDFSPEKQNRFWGFVTRVPNWLWQLTHVLMPLALVVGLVFYLGREKR